MPFRVDVLGKLYFDPGTIAFGFERAAQCFPVVGEDNGDPEVKAFSDWLVGEASRTRHTVGDIPDTDLCDDLG